MLLFARPCRVPGLLLLGAACLLSPTRAQAEDPTPLRAFKGHTGVILCVAFSPDGKRIASGSQDGTVRVWDAQTGKELLCLRGHTRWVGSVTFSAGGGNIASASDQAVKVWDAETGKQRHSFKCANAEPPALAFTPDGRRLLGVGDSVWDFDPSEGRAASLADLKDNLGARPTNVAISPGCGSFYASSRLHAGAFFVESGQERFLFKELGECAAYSRDGKRVATAQARGDVRVWDAETGLQKLCIRSHPGVSHVAFSPDGKLLATASPTRAAGTRPSAGEVRVWDARTGKRLHSLKGVEGPIAFSPDGKQLLTRDGTKALKSWAIRAK